MTSLILYTATQYLLPLAAALVRLSAPAWAQRAGGWLCRRSGGLGGFCPVYIRPRGCRRKEGSLFSTPHFVCHRAFSRAVKRIAGSAIQQTFFNSLLEQNEAAGTGKGGHSIIVRYGGLSGCNRRDSDNSFFIGGGLIWRP